MSDNWGELAGTVHQLSGATYEMLVNQELDDEPDNIASADTDGDGLKEIILSTATWRDPEPDYSVLRILEQTAPNSLVYSEVWNSGTSLLQVADDYGSMAVEDVDGDGKEDIVLATGSPLYDVTHSVYYFTSNGNNSLSVNPVVNSSTYGYSNVSIGDSDNDGAKEIIVSTL